MGQLLSGSSEISGPQGITEIETSSEFQGASGPQGPDAPKDYDANGASSSSKPEDGSDTKCETT